VAQKFEKVRKSTVGIGETLPLFGLPSIAKSSDSDNRQVGRRKQRSNSGQNRPSQSVREYDQHMQAAWDLAKVLKRANRLRPLKRGGVQRRQTGIAICQHLAASLQMQSQREAERSRDNSVATTE